MGVNRFVVDDLEIEYINLTREAKQKGYTAEDLRLALDMLDMARGKK
jgi:hypothetical protein